MDVSGEPSSPPSAFDHAYDFLKTRIREGSLASGARIKAEDVATELGISRMPVREAIRRLDSEGLVTIRPNRGAIVAVLGAEEILELFEMRSVLEGLVIRRAIGKFDEDGFEELELRLNRLGRVGDDVDRWIVRHNEFHDYICSVSGGRRLVQEVRRLRTAVEPYLRMALDLPQAEGVVAEHRSLVEAIRRGDAQAAEVEMRQHVLSTAHDVIRSAEARG